MWGSHFFTVLESFFKVKVKSGNIKILFSLLFLLILYFFFTFFFGGGGGGGGGA